MTQLKTTIKLIKINLLNMFSAIFKMGKLKKMQMTILYVFLFLLVSLSMGVTYYPLAQALSMADMTQYTLLLAGIINFCFILIFTVYESQGHFFKTKDFELLISLPIKNSQVVLAKFFSVLISTYIYQAFIMLPGVIVYFIFAGVNIGALLCSIVGLVFAPLIPMCLGLLIGLAISFFSSKTKRYNLFVIIFSFAFLAGYLVLYSQMNTLIAHLTTSSGDIMQTLNYVLPSVTLFIYGGIMAGGLNLLLLVGISFVVLLFTIFLIALNYKKINFALNKTHIFKSKRPLAYQSKSIIASLLKAESKNYFSKSMWVVNTMLGMVFIVAMPVVLYFAGPAMFSGIGVAGLSFDVLLVLMITLFISVSNTTCSSISLEGKSFYLLKCLPINCYDCFAAKILFNFLLNLPFIIVSGILSFILFGSVFNVISTVALFVIPVIASMAVSTFGLLINLCFPKINYQSITQVVKQSTSVMIVTLGTMGVNMLYVMVFLGFVAVPTWLNLTIFFAIYVALFLVSILLLKFKGEKLFNKIGC